ncbi:MAG: WD40 repeat domain-containing protein [Paludisphaera borealis]|uniref:WD40 repeat domain-containing protein n=1 Tax=Paludisphaera borealis TaxID=1387353 RepID=UPI00284819F4|nr:WD40 repeat domain-containing protein [Paludisphaera borealis]MDR3622516.1 WD40 repeat domain-containing protein [Paludisphaera borealis]
MASGAYQDRDARDGFVDDDAHAVTRASGGRVRLSLFTWEGLAGAAVLVTLCVFFAADETPSNDGMIALRGHVGLVESVRFSPDGETLISSSWDKTVKLWDVGPSPQSLGEEMACLPSTSETYAATVSPDGGTVASVGLCGLTMWNWRDSQTFPEVKALFGPCRALAFAPDGRSLAVGSFDHQIRIWEPKSDQVRAVLSGHRDVVRSLVYVPDGSLLISLSFDGELKFWDPQSGREVDRLEGTNRGVHAFSLSPDGTTIALSRLGPDSRPIEIWDLTTNRIKARCPGHAAEVHALVFSPDGRTLASAGGDQRIRFWNVETGNSAGQVDRELGWVRSLDFSRDGRWLAFSGSFNQVYLKRIVLPQESSSTFALKDS